MNSLIHKRCQPRIFCLQKLRPLNVSAAVLCSFYWSCIESVSTFLFLCWFGGLNVKSKNVLIKVVNVYNVCGKTVGERTLKSAVQMLCSTEDSGDCGWQQPRPC